MGINTRQPQCRQEKDQRLHRVHQAQLSLLLFHRITDLDLSLKEIYRGDLHPPVLHQTGIPIDRHLMFHQLQRKMTGVLKKEMKHGEDTQKLSRKWCLSLGPVVDLIQVVLAEVLHTTKEVLKTLPLKKFLRVYGFL